MMNGLVMDALGKDIKAGSTNGEVEFSKGATELKFGIDSIFTNISRTRLWT